MEKRLILTISIIIVIVAITAIYFVQSLVLPTTRIRVTTTTSLYATDLLNYLADEFAKTHKGVSFDFIPVGSGEALRRAELGDACMVFVHAPSLEKEYIAKGIITNQKIFAYNYFIIAGPPSDPAKVRDASNPIDVFKRLYRAGENGEALFISRGDNSGTHVKELSLWSKAELNPRGKQWYRETGSGMGNTLLVANEKKAYVLSDIGTYLKFKKEGKLPDLEILYENGMELINIYSVYLVFSCKNPEKQLAMEFMNFISRDAQELIAKYKVKELGQPLFNPAKDDLDRLRKAWEKLAAS